MMRFMQRLYAVMALCLLAGYANDGVAADVPMLSGRVVNNAELLSSAARERISAALKAHGTKTTNQIAVLTIATLDEDTIEQFATRVFETWKLGTKAKDNGLLLVIVPAERKIRFEVGRGLEGVIPDVMASRTIRNVIAPQFKAKQFDQGVEEGLAAIIKLLEGEPGTIADAKEASSGFKDPNLSIGECILFGVFIFGIIGLFTVIGIFTPGMGWFLYVFLIPFWALFPMVVVGFTGAMTILGVYLVGYPLAKMLLPSTAWYKKRNRTSLPTAAQANAALAASITAAIAGRARRAVGVPAEAGVAATAFRAAAVIQAAAGVRGTTDPSARFFELAQKVFAELCHLGRHHELAVTRAGITREIFLMVLLGDVKHRGQRYLGHNRVAP